MILDLVAIFRARRDPRLAVKLAARFAQGQAIERITAPLFIAHILLWILISTCVLIIVGLFAAASALHWSVGIAAVIPMLVGGCALIVERGLRTGMDRVRNTADRLTDRGVNRLIRATPSKPTVIEPHEQPHTERSQD